MQFCYISEHVTVYTISIICLKIIDPYFLKINISCKIYSQRISSQICDIRFIVDAYIFWGVTKYWDRFLRCSLKIFSFLVTTLMNYIIKMHTIKEFTFISLVEVFYS